MSYSYTRTSTETFTRTIARYIASKVATDLHRMYSYYGQPSLERIDDYLEELTELLVGDYVQSVEYGFKRDNNRVVSLYYEVRSDGTLTDSRAGGVYARADITGATWFSFLTFTSKWFALVEGQRDQVEKRLPFRRSDGEAPQQGDGYWVTDRAYTLDGVGTQRRIFRPY
jgi:hypothetical protein